MKKGQVSDLSSRKPDYAYLEQNLILLEKKKIKEISFYNDIASLIAYQQMLCSHLGIVHTNLSEVVPQIRRPFPSLPFSNRSISMSQTSQYVKLLINITKLLWAIIADKSDSADIFFNVHKKFNDLILTRNKFILMGPGPRPNATFKESNSDHPSKNDQKNDSILKAFNLTVKGNDKLDNSFLPGDLNLRELENKAGPEPTEEKLTAILDDLFITQKELYNYIDSLTKNQVDGYFFQKFPNFSVIKQHPLFNEAMNSISCNATYVRSELYNYSETISNTLQDLRVTFEKFENCFALPQIPFNITKHLINVESQHYMAIRKGYFFKNIVQKADMKPPHKWTSLGFLENELRFFEEMKSSLIDEKFEKVSNLINAHLENLSKSEISEEIIEEKNVSQEIKTNAEIASNKWLEKSIKSTFLDNQNEQKLQKNYKEAQDEIEEKESRNNLIRSEIYSSLTNTIGRAKQLIYHLSGFPIIPPTFEQKMNIHIEKEARIKALKMKAEALNKDINKKKEEIEKLKKKSDLLDKQIQQKKDEFDNYKKKSANNSSSIVDASKSLEEFDKFEDLYCCCFHPKERREVFLKGCKHSFCQKCTKTQIKERNRKCPYCQNPFNQLSDIININWDKGHK